ncbi:hypothetical protein [Anaplasma bovis]|uniref:hypothetical protein n=1 Tax=Anaplasma bovis TaxID=186733 RepID=UPI002FEE71C0
MVIVTMVRVVRSLAGICACVFLLLFWVDTTKATTEGASASSEPECKNGLQGVSAGTSILPSEYDDVEDKIRICGASPNCNTCVEMYRGDCGYVFPTNVTVIEEKRHDGKKELCACQTFACDLAWDPAGWNKKCFTKIKCIPKKPHYDKISLEQALCGGEDGPSVRFCPLTFSKQGYFSPGLVTSVLYEGEKTPYRQYEIINKFVPGSRSTGSGASAQLPHHEGSITSRKGETFHYVAYKKEDSLCLRYGGKRGVNTSRSKNEADFDTCIPIPVPERPVMYVSKSDGEQMINGRAFGITPNDRDAILKDAMYRNRALFAEMDVMKYGNYVAGKRRYVGVQDHVSALLKTLVGSSGIQYLCMQRKSLFQEACSNTKTAVEFPRDVKYKERECTMADSVVDTAVAKFFSGYVFSRLKDNIKDIGENIPITVAGRECRVAKQHMHNTNGEGSATVGEESLRCEYTEAPVISEFQHTMARVRRGYDVSEEMERRRSSTALGKKVVSSGQSLVSKIPLFDYHAMGEVVCADMPQGDIEFEVLEGASITINCSSNTLRCEEKTRGHGRFRVRKKPKTLRRYVMVGSKGERRRIRCDDKYSIDLYALSQEVLDKSVVHGNKFVLPKEYLINTLSDNTEDPCYSSRSEIVYFYEDGGFVSDADLSKCANPITEYYASGKAIRGCEYSYIRSDNYEPFLEEGNISGFSIVPLSKYEQGFCIDNFSRILFEPKSLNNVATEQQTSHCFKHGSKNNVASALTTEYRFPINNNSFAVEPASKDGKLDASGSAQVRKKCTFYKVEMWGGGEAARREGESEKGSKRSGRPGQYVSLLLDLFDEYVRASCTSCSNDEKCKEAVKILNTNKKFSLLMNIGVGGQQGGSSDTTDASTKGGDTILYLCGDDPIQGLATCDSESVAVKDTREGWPYKVINNPLFDQKDAQATSQPESLPSAAGNQVSGANCYEIARAVGGGSDMLGEPWHGPHNKVLKYHRTISTNVLSSDKSGMKLLLGGEAMFTKIPVEVNMYDDNGGIGFATGGYLAQRSLPKERCNYIETPASDVSVQGPLQGMKMTLIVPGMGGCWGKEAATQTGGAAPVGTPSSTEDKPGAGRNGAVIITCERWGNGMYNSDIRAGS